MKNKELIISNQVKHKIFTIRNKQVIIDSDLAELYEISTGALNQAVKRNISRFPKDFMFQLTKKERDEVITNCDNLQNSKFSPKLPYVFTEQGVASLSGILKSDKAIEMNIQIMRAFVSMRRFIQKNAELFLRLDTVERKQLEYQLKSDKNFTKLFDAIENKDLVKTQGIFYDGQIFDAYKFISDLLKVARKSIILIDSYIDESVLILFTKINKEVSVKIYTRDITKQLKLDLEKYNQQYSFIEIKELKKCHDRFLIIDNKEIYHIGASIKDLGKKWFAISKLDKDALEIISKL